MRRFHGVGLTFAAGRGDPPSSVMMHIIPWPDRLDEGSKITLIFC